MTVSLQEFRDLHNNLQYIIDWADKNGYLPEHCFTFPDGETWYSTDLLRKEEPE